MNRALKRLWIFFIFTLLMSILLVGTVGAAPRLTLDPWRITGREGKTVRLNVRIDDVVDCFAWQFEMFWDSDVLELDNYYTVPFLSRHYYYESYPSAYDGALTYETSPTAHTNSSGFQFKTTATETSVDLAVDGWGGERDAWDKYGDPPYLDTKDDLNEVADSDDNDEIGDFTFADHTVGAGEALKTVTLSVYARAGATGKGSVAYIYLYDGTSWTNVMTVEPTSTTYLDYTTVVTSTLDSWTKVNGAKMYMEYYDAAGGSTYVMVDEAHLHVTYDVLTPLDPANAYDDDLTSKTGFTTNQTGYFEMSGPSTASYPYTITRVDLKIHYCTPDQGKDPLDPNPDEYRIVFYVGSTGPEVLQTWTNGSYGIEPPIPGLPWSAATRTFRDLFEPIDGVWNWTDLSDMRFRFETKLNGTAYAKDIDLYEAWLEVRHLSVSATDPEKAYDQNDATCASFKYDVDGNFSVLTFPTPMYEYIIDKVEFSMRYSAEAPTDDRYRIVYTVDPSPTKKVLESWTSAGSSLATHTWADNGEPNDGTWSWMDIAKANIMVETDLVDSSDDKSFSLYEAWITVEYHRDSFGAVTEETGYLFLGYTIQTVGGKPMDGVSGNQNIVVFWFNVLSAGSTHPIVVQRIKLMKSGGAGAMFYGPVVGVSGFVDGTMGWTEVGEPPYLHLKNDGNYTYTAAGDTSGNFTFEDQSGLAGLTPLNRVELSVYAKQSPGGNDEIEVHLWDGSAWTLADTIVPTENYASYVCDVSSILDSWNKVDYAKIKLAHNINETADTVYVDQASLLVNRIHSYYITAWAEDIDMDGYVDIMDLCLIGISFGKTGDPGWIDEDVVKDGVIDIEDLVAVAMKFSAGSYL